MEMIIILVAILQSIAISLGVGCSTLAIVNYFVAFADGKIDQDERRMMGVVYVMLRIAMVFILLTTVLLALCELFVLGTDYITVVILSTWTLVFMLFFNALLMTKHIMPPTIGPALQASTWYTLGVLMALEQLYLLGFSYLEFFIGYLAAICLGISIVNGTMSYLKNK